MKAISTIVLMFLMFVSRSFPAEPDQRVIKSSEELLRAVGVAADQQRRNLPVEQQPVQFIDMGNDRLIPALAAC